MDPVELLLERIRNGGQWPPRSEAAIWANLRKWRAFAESDRAYLAGLAGYDTAKHGRYRVDALGDRIRQGWADYLFGGELRVAPPEERDVALYEELVEVNNLDDEVHAAEADICVPDGEVWWRIYTDPDVAEMPLVEWHSRLSVVPYYVGARLMAAALVSTLTPRPRERSAVWRHFEIHAAGVVEHVLYRGTKTKLGNPVPIDSHPELEPLAATLGGTDIDELGRGARWDHRLDGPLMGRIINRRGRKPSLGKSEFQPIEDQLLDLNDLANIGAGNVKLTARKRIVVPDSALSRDTSRDNLDVAMDGDGNFIGRPDGLPLDAPQPSFDAAEDVLVADPVNEELGRDGAPPFKVLEYSFDAAPLIEQKRDVVETALTRVGMTPQWVGVSTGGNDSGSTSGFHYRLRMIPTDKGGRGKGRAWDAELPRILLRCAQVANLAEGDGGLGLEFGDVVNAPAVTRPPAIPVDEVEEAQAESALVTARIRSRKSAIKRLNPDWDDGQVDAELALIDEDKPATTSLDPFGGGGAGA